MDTPVASLSGGNQQKVVVAREFSRPLKLLVAAQPTRGVDVGSIEFIHKRIIAERDPGTAVLSSGPSSTRSWRSSDRIAVMYDGRIVGIVAPTSRARTSACYGRRHGRAAGDKEATDARPDQARRADSAEEQRSAELTADARSRRHLAADREGHRRPRS